MFLFWNGNPWGGGISKKNLNRSANYSNPSIWNCVFRFRKIKVYIWVQKYRAWYLTTDLHKYLSISNVKLTSTYHLKIIFAHSFQNKNLKSKTCILMVHVNCMVYVCMVKFLNSLSSTWKYTFHQNIELLVKLQNVELEKWQLLKSLDFA